MASIVSLASIREARRRQGGSASVPPDALRADLPGDLAHAADELVDLIARLDMRGERCGPLPQAVDWLRARAAAPDA